MPDTGIILPFFKITWLSSKIQNIDVGKLNGKINYTQPSVKLKLVGLPYMVKTGPEPSWLKKNFKSGRSLNHAVNFSGNQIALLAGFLKRATLMPKRDI